MPTPEHNALYATIAKHSWRRMIGRVMHADALDLLRSLPDACVDMILTSPPYDNLRTYNGYSFDFERIAHESYRVLKSGGVLVWVVGDATIDGCETLTSMRQALYFVDECGFKMNDTMIWQKQKNSSPNVSQNPIRYSSSFEYMFVLSRGVPLVCNLQHETNRNAGKRRIQPARQRQRCGLLKEYGGGYVTSETSPYGNVWYIVTGRGHSHTDELGYRHPATFPEEIARRHIMTWTNPGDLILDPFLGSGTTAKVARHNLRQFIGGDISSEYCTVARARINIPYTIPMFPK
jgi:site-specific DNA-methyltransferase (adenine-specific)